MFQRLKLSLFKRDDCRCSNASDCRCSSAQSVVVQVSLFQCKKKLICGCSRVIICRCSIVNVCRCSSVNACRCSSVNICRCSRVDICRCSNVNKFFTCHGWELNPGPSCQTKPLHREVTRFLWEVIFKDMSMFQRVDVPVCRCSSVSRVDVPLCRCSSVSMFHRSKCDCSSVIVPAHYCRCYRRVVLSFVFVSMQLKIVASTHENGCVSDPMSILKWFDHLFHEVPRPESGIKNVHIMISFSRFPSWQCCRTRKRLVRNGYFDLIMYLTRN